MILWTLYLSSLLREGHVLDLKLSVDKLLSSSSLVGQISSIATYFSRLSTYYIDKVCMEKKTDGRIWWRPLQVFPVGTPWCYYSASAELDNCGEEAARWLPISPTFGASGSAWLWKPTFVGGSIVDRTASFGHLRVVHAPPWLACGSMIKERKKVEDEGGGRERPQEGR